MIVKKKFVMTLLSICAAILLVVPFAAAGKKRCTGAGNGNIKQLDAGEEWVVTETTNLRRLTVGEGATITAADGYSVTLTVNGVETPIEERAYKGRLVLTVTEDIEIQYGELDPHKFRTAVYIEDGAYVPEKSVAAAVRKGRVTDTAAKKVKITSVGDEFNGIMVTGDSVYNIERPKIVFTGNGGNDFAGYGAAIMSSGSADVVVNRAKVITNGAIRTAAFVGGNSTMEFNDSYLEVKNGTLPEDYEFTVEMGKMMEVPWMLGLTGNSRATNLVANGVAYYNNSHIKAQGWGVLSTDDTETVRLYVTDSLIETVDSGYGAYSIGDSIDTFSGCKINVADMALIMANGEASGIFTDGTVVNSGRFGVMMHSNEGGTLTIDEGSVFNTESAVIQTKSSNPTIIVDNAELKSANGIILQAIVNDDPFFAAMGMPLSGSNVTATFSNTALNGDIINGNTEAGDVIVTFQNATIKGAITTAETEQALSPDGEALGADTPDLYYLIGELVHTYTALPYADNAMEVTLEENSTWIVDETSFLTSLTIDEGSKVTAPSGANITMTVDGSETEIVVGTYTGEIVISVN